MIKTIAFYAYLLANLICFGLYAADKFLSIKHKWRISEKNLLLASLFGPFGAFVAMCIVRHKTKHTKFVCLVTLFVLFHALALYWLLA